jgi:hypothetical protein
MNRTEITTLLETLPLDLELIEAADWVFLRFLPRIPA